jgi:hypothetical protein
MLILVTTSVVLGALLATRFKAWILCAAVPIGAIVVAASGIANGTSIWSILLGLVAFMLSLQLGYFAGACAMQALTVWFSKKVFLKWKREIIDRDALRSRHDVEAHIAPDYSCDSGCLSPNQQRRTQRQPSRPPARQKAVAPRPGE